MLENLDLKKIAVKLADELYPNKEDINKNYLYRTGAFDGMSELESIANKQLIIIQRLRLIEGMFKMFAKINDISNLQMHNNGTEIYFSLNEFKSIHLNRTKLEKMSYKKLIEKIYSTLQSIYF